MGFERIIEYRMSEIDEMRKAGDGWAHFGDGPPTAVDLDVVEDRG